MLISEVCFDAVDWFSEDNIDDVSINSLGVVVSIFWEVCIGDVDWTSDDIEDGYSVDCCDVVVSLLEEVCIVVIDWPTDDISVCCSVVIVSIFGDIVTVLVETNSEDNVDKYSSGWCVLEEDISVTLCIVLVDWPFVGKGGEDCSVVVVVVASINCCVVVDSLLG